MPTPSTTSLFPHQEMGHDFLPFPLPSSFIPSFLSSREIKPKDLGHETLLPKTRPLLLLLDASLPTPPTPTPHLPTTSFTIALLFSKPTSGNSKLWSFPFFRGPVATAAQWGVGVHWLEFELFISNAWNFVLLRNGKSSGISTSAKIAFISKHNKATSSWLILVVCSGF